MTQINACRSLIMAGTDTSTKGGISSVIRGYRSASLFKRFSAVYVPTHGDGGAFFKATMALKAWYRITRLLLRLDAPLVHIHVASRASFYRKYVITLIVRAFGRPYILHLHGGEFQDFYEKECGRLSRSLIVSAFGHAALTIVLSDSAKAFLLRICPHVRAEVLPNALQLPDASRIGHPSLEHDSRVLFLGRLEASKGVATLIKAFALVAREFPNSRLVCAGEGNLDRWRQLATELGVEERVAFPGWLTAEQCEKELAQASVFALPSHAEGLPMALLEAMAWQLAIVTTPVGGIPDVIAHGTTGLFVKPDNVDELSNAIAQLLEKPELRAKLGLAARLKIQTSYSMEAHIKRLVAIYCALGLRETPQT